MSGHGFHVHGPHDHELEHATQGGHDNGGMIAQIAVVTAIIATVGALFSYQGGATQANAGLYKKKKPAIKARSAATKPKKPPSNWGPTNWKPTPSPGTGLLTSSCTSITAGHRPPPCCRCRLRWPPLRC